MDAKKKTHACDLSYRQTTDGFLRISAMVEGHLEKRFYGGYSKRDATQMFLREMNDPKRETT